MRTVFLDTETTGLHGRYAGGSDEIVELGILDNRGKPLINQLVRPSRREAWPEAQRIHGISPAMVADTLTLDALLPDIGEAIRDCLVVIYNAAFDLQFFPQELFGASRVECAMLRYAAWKGDWNPHYGNPRWHKLHVAAKATGFKAEIEWHRALGDTIACRHVWQHLERCTCKA
jgi:DNA polymerase III epsilon subunit-like protein